MAKVLGKLELCSTDSKYFKSEQGIRENTLFDRYPALETIVKNNIDAQYQHFLAQPVRNGNTITWFGKTYGETPKLFSDLQGAERVKYAGIKDETLDYYRNKTVALRQSNENAKAEFLAAATKFVDERFIYCYDNKVVLCAWGMQLRYNVREPAGVAVKNLFVKLPPKVEPPAPDDPVHIPEPVVYGEAPPPPPPLPLPPPLLPRRLSWWERFWLWLTGLGCLKWLLWLLLFLLLLLLCWWLFRNCQGSGDIVRDIPGTIKDRPWTDSDPNVGDAGGIYDPGKPYTPVPTPPGYTDVLPPAQGVLPPVDDELEIIPGNPTVIGNLLNILMENNDKSITDLAKDFKTKYPDNKYRVVYYDDVIKRMQIRIPSAEREHLK